MTAVRDVLVLDSVFDDLTVEADAARSVGWSATRWDGSDAALADASVVVHVRTRIDDGFLDRAPGLRVVGRFGTGLDTVDQPAAARRGIAVVGVRDYCTPELVAHTLALAFVLERRLDVARALRLEPSATWDEIGHTVGIVGRTRAAVIGFGAIGSAVTRALLAAGWQVRVVTDHGGDEARALGAEPSELDPVLSWAQVVFLHAGLTERTRGLIDARRLAAMPAGSLLIDTARLGLIDEAAVADAIAGGHLAGVALDARLDPGGPLARLGDDVRLVVTPHIGWYSERSARVLRQRTIIESIAAQPAANGGGA